MRGAITLWREGAWWRGSGSRERLAEGHSGKHRMGEGLSQGMAGQWGRQGGRAPRVAGTRKCLLRAWGGDTPW